MIDLGAEWLLADGRGGFASGTVGGPRTRRYHALLLTATAPPTGRVLLVNGFEAWIDLPQGPVPISSQHYRDTVFPDARPAIVDFVAAPWPTWTLALPGGVLIEHQVVVARATGHTVLRWRLLAGAPCGLRVRLLFSGRDPHALHHENPGFGFDPVEPGVWRPYPGVPAVTVVSNGTFRPSPDWYRGFYYETEADRGMDAVEDLASPGVYSFDLATPAFLTLAAEGGGPGIPGDGPAAAYIATRDKGATVLAGFPWFTDWGRDTFIAMRGLLIGAGRLDLAERVLAAWAPMVDHGMLPNRFPERGGAPEYNSVDAALWFVVAVHDLLDAWPDAPSRPELEQAVLAILSGYCRGTRHGIAACGDGLLRAGVAGQQLTWMDAKLGDWVVTPRMGKPVEIQALWINALRIGGALLPEWEDLAEKAQASFLARFPDPDTGGLFDVVDDGHVPGAVDRRVRPNQIFAVGGLPHPIVTGGLARGVVDLVAARLLTPMGLRTLDPADPDYRGRYAGDLAARDGAYHQGTVWPWLIGPFVQAWARVHGSIDPAHLATLRAWRDGPGLGHLPEVADGDAPHHAGGCSAQAWSLGELMRAEHMA